MKMSYLGESCILLSSRILFGVEVCTIFLSKSGRVLEVARGDLEESPGEITLSKDEIVALIAAGKITDSLNSYRQAFGEDVLLAPLDSSVTPLPHQLDTLKRSIERLPVRKLFADEVGLGKTIEAGLVLRELKLRGLAKRILVVAPTGLVKQWVAELKTHFGEDFQILLPNQVEAAGSLLQAARLKLDVSPDAAENPYFFCDQVVCPLDAIKPLKKRKGWTKEEVDEYNSKRYLKLVQAEWDLVIIDESHRVAGAGDGVARYLLAKGLADTTPNLLLLSATPHQGKSDAFHRLLSLLDEDAFPSGVTITRNQVAPYLIRHEKRKVVDGCGNLLFRPRMTKTLEVEWGHQHQTQRELYSAVTKYLELGYARTSRLTKSKRVAIGFLLALIQRLATSSTAALARFLEKRVAQLESSTKLVVESVEDDVAFESLDDCDIEDAQEYILHIKSCIEDELTHVKELANIACQTEKSGIDAKAEKLLSLLNEMAILEGNSQLKALVFTEFRTTQEMLCRLLTQRGFCCVTLNGSLSIEERLECQRRFASDAQILIATEAGGEGLNLQFCHFIINYDLPWNPMRVEQRIGRVDRIGQQYEVKAFNFLLAETVDFHVRKVLEQKLSVVLNELGVDKIGDVLDTGEADILFAEAYTASLQGGMDAEAEKIEGIERAIQMAARSAKEFASLYRNENPGTELAEHYLHHPFPYWVEQLMVCDCRAQGGSVEKDLFGWTLRYADGETLQNVVFGLEALTNSPTAKFISVNQAIVQDTLKRVLQTNALETKQVVLKMRQLPKCMGRFYLCRISGRSGDWMKERVVPCFEANGRFEGVTARRVYEFLLSGEFDVVEYNGSCEEDSLAKLEPHLLDTFMSLQNLYQQERDEEYVKKQQLFKNRSRSILKLGLESVKKSRLAKLEYDKMAYEQEYNQREQLLPGLKILFSAFIYGGV